MIINESNSNKKDYEELEIVNPQKFISAMGGIMDSGLKESDESMDDWRKDMIKKNIKDTLKRNKMSVPPTPREIQRSGNKIKVPWFLVGTLLSKAHTYGLEKKAKDR